ncbi:MAG: PRC-barrel domain-containing protein [Polyangia bacterium]|jgi:sporulation protein YlmC with PRC-barrel domain
MLRGLKDIEEFAISATDGDIGRVANFLFDDDRWVVRYLVVETGGFLAGRRVLISPISFRLVDWGARRFHLALTMEKVKSSPSVDVNKPVSRQHERNYYSYYGYPYYWGYAGLWGSATSPRLLAAGTWNEVPTADSEKLGDVHLRSVNEVRGYHIHGKDATIGQVDDFIIDDETWAVRYLVIDTSNWWFGKKVLVAPHWASRISWAEANVYLDMSRQAIKDGPEWKSSVPISREYEARLHDYHKRPAYWDAGDAGTPAARVR